MISVRHANAPNLAQLTQHTSTVLTGISYVDSVTWPYLTSSHLDLDPVLDILDIPVCCCLRSCYAAFAAIFTG
jgi:hypothetical protein